VPQIKEAELKKSMVRIYFNNHARAKSVRKAFLLMDLLLIEHKQKEIKSLDQFPLESSKAALEALLGSERRLANICAITVSR
jgi:hypothetical protein